MASSSYPKHKKKTLESTWRHFGTQNELRVKINLDPMVRWRGLDKINVHKIYNTFFQQPLGFMFVVHET
jgi:hypothetical protein